jgi:endo-1,4-beta-xylanase
MGLKVLVTELDVDDSMLRGDLVGRDATVAAQYRAYLDTFLQSPALVAVLTWGLSDRYNWLGSTARPLPFDRDLSAKPAWYAMADTLSAD